MTSRATVGSALFVCATALGLLIDAGRPQRPAAGIVPCDRAVMVDGLLRCDAEVPRDVDALCPGEGPDAHEPIAAGDALATARLCTRDEVRRGANSDGWTRMDPDDLRVLAQPVDINHADVAELASLPGVGSTIGTRIVTGRPYSEVDELIEVKGIGPKRLARIRARARVGP
jgi:competence protein ComEA